MKTKIENYFDRLDQVIGAVEQNLKDENAVLHADASLTDLDGHLPYGQTRCVDLALVTYRGKPTRKWFHASVYRLETGRYELTCYYL